MKIDLHTHSIASPDGSLTEAQYRQMLDSGGLDCVAITDHNTTAFARELQRKLRDRIIVGEEITTADGEIIGLYLKRDIPSGLSALETVQAIKEQGGLVYIPHPFETVRKGVSLNTLEAIAGYVDIVEIVNGRAVFQNKSKQAGRWAAQHRLPGAASSDAHGWHGWGKTYSIVEHMPARTTLPELLVASTHRTASPGIRGVLYPKFNRLRRKHA
jgi:predicted metal-dependent phosphoesterase TrpH